MHVRDLLLSRQAELKASIAEVEAELAQIALALKAIAGGEEIETQRDFTNARTSPIAAATNVATLRHRMPVNDAIVLAVEAGNKTPTDILNYLRRELRVMTTINSVRSRVSSLKSDGRIAHDGTGWIPVDRI